MYDFLSLLLLSRLYIFLLSFVVTMWISHVIYVSRYKYYLVIVDDFSH